MPPATARVWVLCVLGLMGLTGKAQAQMCHGAAALPRDEALQWGTKLTSTFAAFDNAAGRGEYQGVSLGVDVAVRGVAVQATLPAYRLDSVAEDATYHGLGDLGAAARITVYRSEDGGVAFGPELAAMFPTGRGDRSLGMGHVMLMPGAWLSLTAAAWSLQAQLAFAKALADKDAHQHGTGHGPIVDPMSSSELQHSLGVSHVLVGQARWHARLVGAVPVFANLGRAQGLFGVGLSVLVLPFDLGFEIALPVVGDAVTSRTQVWLGARF
jgi:hypothetical protein